MTITMNRLLPQPLLSLTLLLTWLLANEFSAAHAVLGSVLAIVIPWFSQHFWPERVRIGQPVLALRFVGRVLLDIITANITVARLILGPMHTITPRFVHYPLQLQDEFAITVLANTISLTPGTVSADVTHDRQTLLIHALDVDDEKQLIEEIHKRYEQPLLEIFESC